MASNLVFDPSQFESLIGKFGIKKAWINILATHISSFGEKFLYILEDETFKGYSLHSENLLDKLSIGEVGVLYEYCVAHVDASSRKDNGQFFTPDDVAILMVKHSSGFPKGKWLDPCSGIGNLSWHLVNFQEDKEDFLINNMVLSDRDDIALLIARVLFTISFQVKHKNLYNEIPNSFVKFDFLSVSENLYQLSLGTSGLEAIPAHDYVIVNPPYLSIKGEDQRFETSKARDLYAYFLENIIKTSKGFISITPQSFTNAGKFESLRKLLLTRYETLKIYTFDNIPGNIFFGVKFGSTNSNTANSIRACIVVAGSFLEPKGHQITSLLRWRTQEREVLFSEIEKFLSKPKLTAEYFPKVNSKFVALYNKVSKLKTLDSILSPSKTEFVLYVPSAPRYFISALKKPVSRTSLKSLYFQNNNDLNKAYLLLNSSFMYWWWRVRDGGMTLSFETIKSLPLLDFEIDKKIINKLVKSETSNMVFKMNAGALQENVKHDSALISEVNELVAPKYSKLLILTHENSELVQLKTGKKKT
jgi:hypothetical protein